MPRGVDAAPDFAPLHPGYACCITSFIVGKSSVEFHRVIQRFSQRFHLNLKPLLPTEELRWVGIYIYNGS
jgi:hypothetical protein